MYKGGHSPSGGRTPKRAVPEITVFKVGASGRWLWTRKQQRLAVKQPNKLTGVRGSRTVAPAQRRQGNGFEVSRSFATHIL